MIARLYALAEDHWPRIDAHYAHINLLKLPMHRFLNCVYTWCIERVPPDKVEMWEMMLAEPLNATAAKKAPTPMTEEDEGLAFMAAMNAVRR